MKSDQHEENHGNEPEVNATYPVDNLKRLPWNVTKSDEAMLLRYIEVC